MESVDWGRRGHRDPAYRPEFEQLGDVEHRVRNFDAHLTTE
jgi:hypothetical protein